MIKFSILAISIILLSSFVPLPADALWGKAPEKEHMEQARDNAYESAQKATEAAQKAFEAAKEGTLGFGEKLSDTAGAAREAASSIGGKVVDSFEPGNVYQGARDTAGDLYEGAKERAGNLYEGAQETADAVRQRAAHLAGMGRQQGEQLRGKADNLYEDASHRAQHLKRESQSWLGWMWDQFWNIILFIPRTIFNSLSWAWHTSCDVAEDTYEGVRDRAGDAGERIRDKSGQLRERAGDYAQQAGDFVDRTKEKAYDTYEDLQGRAREVAGNAKDRLSDAGEGIQQRAQQAKQTVTGTGQRAAEKISEKAHQAGDYIRGRGEQYFDNGEELLQRSQEMGERVRGKVGHGKSWLRCQAERIFKTLLTLALLSFVVFLSFLFFLSPNRQQKVRQQIRSVAGTVRDKTIQAREKAAPYVQQYMPYIGLRRTEQQQQVGVAPKKGIVRLQKETDIPVQHHEKTTTLQEEKHESEDGGVGTRVASYAEKTREREEPPHKQRT